MKSDAALRASSIRLRPPAWFINAEALPSPSPDCRRGPRVLSRPGPAGCRPEAACCPTCPSPTSAAPASQPSGMKAAARAGAAAGAAGGSRAERPSPAGRGRLSRSRPGSVSDGNLQDVKVPQQAFQPVTLLEEGALLQGLAFRACCASDCDSPPMPDGRQVRKNRPTITPSRKSESPRAAIQPLERTGEAGGGGARAGTGTAFGGLRLVRRRRQRRCRGQWRCRSRRRRALHDLCRDAAGVGLRTRHGRRRNLHLPGSGWPREAPPPEDAADALQELSLQRLVRLRDIRAAHEPPVDEKDTLLGDEDAVGVGCDERRSQPVPRASRQANFRASSSMLARRVATASACSTPDSSASATGSPVRGPVPGRALEARGGGAAQHRLGEQCRRAGGLAFQRAPGAVRSACESPRPRRGRASDPDRFSRLNQP